MPRLQQYVSTQTPNAPLVRGVIPGAVNVSGLIGGMQDAANAIQHTADVRAAEMERERKALAIEEAQSAVSKTVSDGRAMWTERLVNAQQNATDASGFTVNTLKEFDGWA